MKPEKCAAAEIKPPRRILFEGPFGSGKSLALLITAKIATEHGWTFIHMPPTTFVEGGNNGARIEAAMELARKYQESVLSFEDVDREQRAHDPDTLGKISASIDGVASKNAQVIVITSTNYVDRITAIMQRPGRTNKIVRFGTFTAENAKELIMKKIPARLLSGDVDWEKVCESYKDFPPAFVKVVGENATILAVSESVDQKIVTTEIIVEAAVDLQKQHKKACDELGFNKNK